MSTHVWVQTGNDDQSTFTAHRCSVCFAEMHEGGLFGGRDLLLPYAWRGQGARVIPFSTTCEGVTAEMRKRVAPRTDLSCRHCRHDIAGHASGGQCLYHPTTFSASECGACWRAYAHWGGRYYACTMGCGPEFENRRSA